MLEAGFHWPHYCCTYSHLVSCWPLYHILAVCFCHAYLYIALRDTDTAWYSSLAASITVCHLQNCTDDVRLFSRPMSEVLWWCVHSYKHQCCAFVITISGPWRPRPTRAVDLFWLPQLLHVCSCAPKIWNELPRICEAQTPGNSFSIVLSAGCSSVHTARGASDRLDWKHAP